MAALPQRTDIDMNEFLKRLQTERANLMGLHHEQDADMLEEARQVSETELSSTDFNEPGDNAAEFADRDRDAAQDSNIVGIIHEIDHAIDRIHDGSYGICIVTGKPIPVERLRAIPWATMTVEAAEDAVQ